MTSATGQVDTVVMTAPMEHETPWYERADDRGISMEWLAAMTGVSWSTVYAYRTGRRKVQPSWLAKVELLIVAHDNMPGSGVKVS